MSLHCFLTTERKKSQLITLTYKMLHNLPWPILQGPTSVSKTTKVGLATQVSGEVNLGFKNIERLSIKENVFREKESPYSFLATFLRARDFHLQHNQFEREKTIWEGVSEKMLSILSCKSSLVGSIRSWVELTWKWIAILGPHSTHPNNPSSQNVISNLWPFFSKLTFYKKLVKSPASTFHFSVASPLSLQISLNITESSLRRYCGSSFQY